MEPDINFRVVDEYQNIAKKYLEEFCGDSTVIEDEKKEITSFKIGKQYIDSGEEHFDPYINAEYLLDENRKPKMVHIMHIKNIDLDIYGICLDIPTPFKKGDLLMGYSQSPYWGTSILDSSTKGDG